MSTQAAQSTTPGAGQRTRSCATGLTCHRCDRHYPLESTVFACPDCGKGLDVIYDYERAASHFKDVPGSERPQNIWHFEELLPIVEVAAQARVGRFAGYTPLIRADRLGAELGLSNLYLKDDSTSRPSLSYKDRVVAMSVARLLERGKTDLAARLRQRLTDESDRQRRARHHAEDSVRKRAHPLGVQVRPEQGGEVVLNEFKPLRRRPHGLALREIDSLTNGFASPRGGIESLSKMRGFMRRMATMRKCAQ